MPQSHSTFQITHKTCIAWQSYNIFILWPYLTRPWPWPLLTKRPILTRTFFYSWEAFCQSLVSQLLLVPSQWPVRRKVTVLTFDLTLNWLVSTLRKFSKFTKKCLLRAFDYRLSSLATATGSRFGKGGRGKIYPPPARRVRPETPALRGLIF